MKICTCLWSRSQQRGDVCGVHGSTVGDASRAADPTPAALLEEVVLLLLTAENRLRLAGVPSLAAAAVDLRDAVSGAKREAQAREAPVGGPAYGKEPTCWQCDAPLGSTGACLTCAAKRIEDRANMQPRPDGAYER